MWVRGLDEVQPHRAGLAEGSIGSTRPVWAAVPLLCSQLAGIVPLLITATGHGSRQKCNVNELGFPCSKPKGAKKVKGFQTGDLVRATVTTGTKRGSYVGRVLVRASGSFDIRTKGGRVQGISHRFCIPVHRSDGYSYTFGVRYGPENPSQVAS